MRFLAILALLLLAGCINPQGHAGITSVDITYDTSGNVSGVHLRDGKARDTTVWDIKFGEVELKHVSTGITVDGQAARAAVEKAVVEAMAASAPTASSIAGMVMKALGGL